MKERNAGCGRAREIARKVESESDIGRKKLYGHRGQLREKQRNGSDAEKESEEL